MLVDSHVHTHLCHHASGTPLEYVAAAKRANLEGIVFTDHTPAPDGYDPDNRMSIDQFDEYRSFIFGIRTDHPDFVGFGIEADYYEGCEPYLAAWLPKQNFDVVLGSVHYIGNWPFDNPDHANRWRTSDVTAAWSKYFVLLARLADSRLFDVIAHPDLPKKFGYRPTDIEVIELAKPAFDHIAAAGMAIEINTSGLRRQAQEAYPAYHLLALAHERGIPVCFGSDAHAPNEVGHAFDLAQRLAREAGYSSFARYNNRKISTIPLPE